MQKWVLIVIEQFKTLSSKKSQNIHLVVMNALVLENKEPFSLGEVTFERNLHWYDHVIAYARKCIRP